jgi:hypothetical protein
MLFDIVTTIGHADGGRSVPPHHLQEDSLDITVHILSNYVCPVIVIVGCLNNVFILVVMSLPRYRNIVSCLYLRVLALSDTCNVLGVGTVAIGNTFQLLIVRFGDAFCKGLQFTGYFVSNISTWTIVLMTLTRFIAVVFPLRAKSWCTVKAARCYIGITITVFITWAILPAIYSKAPRSKSLTALQCIIDISPTAFAVYENLHNVLSIVIPFFTKIKLLHYQRPAEPEIGRMTSEKGQGERMVMAMVLAVTVVFLVLLFPYLIQTLVWRLLVLLGYLDEYKIKQMAFSYLITMVIHSFNYACNFYLYCICCTRFRRDFYEIVIQMCYLSPKK